MSMVYRGNSTARRRVRFALVASRESIRPRSCASSVSSTIARASRNEQCGQSRRLSHSRSDARALRPVLHDATRRRRRGRYQDRAAHKIGLGYDHLSRINPKLIYCAISAFGEEGPLCDAPGSELVVQAMAEYTASLGRIGDPPVRVGADIASLNTGIFAAQAILGALYHRLRTGEGQRVAVSEFGSLLHMRGIMWHSLSDPDDWFGFHLEHYTKPPDYGYQAKDGALYFILRRGNTEDWDRLVLELGMEHVLADPRFT